MATGNKIFLADKPTLDIVNTKIGNNTDMAGTSTLFSRVRQIYEYMVNIMMNRIDATVSSRASQTSVNTVGSNVGSNSDSSNAGGSVHAKLKELRTQVLNSSGGDFANTVPKIKPDSTNTNSANVLVLAVNGSGYLQNVFAGSVDPGSVRIEIDGTSLTPWRSFTLNTYAQRSFILRFKTSFKVFTSSSSNANNIGVVYSLD